MRITDAVKGILANYASESPGVRANLMRMLMHGALSGTGKLIILPVDQGFEHGPDRSFLVNEPAYDPHYHFELAIEAGLSAYAAPLGMIACGADRFAGQIPTILKMNSSNSLLPSGMANDQAITASVDDAQHLGCSAIGFTIYPGSSQSIEMFEEISEIRTEASARGLATVIWSYPRGEDLVGKAQTALDIGAYAAHIAALLGAHIIKIKLPEFSLHVPETKERLSKRHDLEDGSRRVAHCMRAAFNGRRIVVFSGGAAKGANDVFHDAKAIRDGGGHGSIIGRNTFQRPREDALKMLGKLVEIYRNGN